jgi:flagellum-specific ATP synthase
MTGLLSRYTSRLQRGQPWRWRGHVVESIGQTIESVGPMAAVGECCEILDRFGQRHLAEVIGFRGSNVLCMPVASTDGIRFGDAVAALGSYPEIEVGTALMGRVLDATGNPMDRGPLPRGLQPVALDTAVRSPLDRASSERHLVRQNRRF